MDLTDPALIQEQLHESMSSAAEYIQTKNYAIDYNFPKRSDV